MRKLIPGLLMLLLSTAAVARKSGLQPGDILFQYIPCGPMCEAIAATTPCAREHPFNHCGVVVRQGDSMLVLEAIGRNVHTTPLSGFLQRDTSSMVYAGRLKDAARGEIDANLERAQALLGRPYDRIYLPGDTAVYCSELVYESYYRNGRRLFHTEPMSFRNTAGTTDPGWTDYYQEMGRAIPEGLPGTNPCAISRDPAITLLRFPKEALLR